MADELKPTYRWIGKPVKRKEDLRLLTGRGRFTGDVKLLGMLHAQILHSPYAHARIRKINASNALSLSGVIDVITGAEIVNVGPPSPPSPAEGPYDRALRDFGIATEKVKFAGEAVALVVAEDKYIAEDALELIEVDYEPLQPVLDPEQAMRSDAPRVHDEAPDNRRCRRFVYGDPDQAFSQADLVVKSRLHFHRFGVTPLETFAALAWWDDSTEVLTLWATTDHIGEDAFRVAHALGLRPEQVRTVCQDLGGSFGNKSYMSHYNSLISYASKKLKRPVKWIMTRTGHLQASSHGNEHIFYAQMAFKKDGTILGMRERLISDEGCRPGGEPRGAMNWIRQPTTVYDFSNLEVEVNAVATNKCPVAPLRSFGKQQHCFLVESLIEEGARKLGMDPAQIRRKNLIRPEQMPFKNPSGGIYDGGNYPALLDKAAKMVDYEGWRARQAVLRKEGRYVGVGVAFGMQSGGNNRAQKTIWRPRAESGNTGSAMIVIDSEGDIKVSVDSISRGNSHETTAAQIVADILGVDPDMVYVSPGFDRFGTAYGDVASGTHGDRFAVVHHGALLGAAARMRDRLLRLGGLLLESPAEELDLCDGKVSVKGSDRSVTLRRIAQLAWLDSGILPQGWEAGLVVHYVYHAPLPRLESPDMGRGNFALTYTPSVAIAVVEVDEGTGNPKVLRFACAEDAGRCINPMVVEGQVQGQVAHQIATALYERHVYDNNGQLLTSTFKDHLVPTAADLPRFECGIIETPSLFTPLGTRGMGEGGGAPLIAVINAIRDALAPLGVQINDSHVTPAELFQLIQDAKKEKSSRPKGE